MATTTDLNKNASQKLTYSCDRRIGVTRYTDNILELTPADIIEMCSKVDVSPYVEHFTIYDSIDSMFRSAEITIKDPTGWRELAPLTGNEIITIAYKSNVTGSDSKEKILIFRIFSISETNSSYGTTTLQNRILVLRLVEFPIFNFLTASQIYKSYEIDDSNTPKLRLTDVLTDCIRKIKYFDKWYDLDIDNSIKNNINVFIPNWNLMKVVNFCKKYAISEDKNYPYYTFHTGCDPTKDKSVIQFKPIYKFIDSNTKFRQYGSSYQETNKVDTSDGQPSADKTVKYSITDVLNEYSFKSCNAKESIDMCGETNVVMDYIEDNEYICNDVSDFFKRYKGINPYVINQRSYGNQWSRFNYKSWNKKEAELLIKNEYQNDLAKILFTSGIECNAMCPLFEARMVGERAELIFNSGNVSQGYDKMYSGAWITWEINDTFVANGAYASIKFLNDSVIEITDPTNTLKNINTITTEQNPENIQ